MSTSPWDDDFLLHGDGDNALGCDSLAVLQISSAVNEMFRLYEAALETRLLQTPTFGAWSALIQDAWSSGVDHITVATSGSTGQPKYCSHSFASLEMETAFLAELFNNRRRIVTYTPAHHIYGLLFAGFLPDRLGTPVVDLKNAGRPSGNGTRSTLLQGDLLVSFPEGWGWIQQNIRTLPSDVEGVTSTAPCPRDLAASLIAGGLSRLVEVYGSSETAGIGTREWPEPHYRLMPHLQRITANPNGGEELQDHSGQRLGLMDDLQFFGQSTFVVTGRKDACVQVGGVNVFPRLIEERLLEHPGVAEVAVRQMRAEEGRRLKCFIVPGMGDGIDDDLENALRTQIAFWPVAAERPTAFRFGSALPRNSIGKLADW